MMAVDYGFQEKSLIIYLFFMICAMNSHSQTTFSPTNARPFITAMPRRSGVMNYTWKMRVSPGTTFWRNLTLSIFMK